MVKDELQALQLACTAMEENYRKVQEENQELVSTFERDKQQYLNVMVIYVSHPQPIIVCLLVSDC